MLAFYIFFLFEFNSFFTKTHIDFSLILIIYNKFIN